MPHKISGRNIEVMNQLLGLTGKGVATWSGLSGIEPRVDRGILHSAATSKLACNALSDKVERGTQSAQIIFFRLKFGSVSPSQRTWPK